jgi:hypothetical protein
VKIETNMPIIKYINDNDRVVYRILFFETDKARNIIKLCAVK